MQVFASRPVSPNTGHSVRYLELVRKLKQDRIVQLFRNIKYVLGVYFVIYMSKNELLIFIDVKDMTVYIKSVGV